MQALVDKFLQRIIHKAMACNPRFTSENGTLNANPEMRPKASAVGAYVACMRSTFV